MNFDDYDDNYEAYEDYDEHYYDADCEFDDW